MQLDLTKKQFRRLLDLVYIGNWVLNSARGPDRLGDYDEVESLLFGKCAEEKMDVLCDTRGPVARPVVHDDDLDVAHRLRKGRRACDLDDVGGIVRGDDDRYTRFVHGASCMPPKNGMFGDSSAWRGK